jgi:DNA-binding PadR family transcriptional regulator
MAAKTLNIDDLLPLNHADLHIMLALADADRHGYGIMLRIAEMTNQKLKLGPGTLYTAIKRLLDGKLIEECKERPEGEADDVRRRYYRMTNFGMKVLSAETVRMQSLLKVARANQLPTRA